jgi:hypothetical protein
MSSVNQEMSLFIPRVFLNITSDRIKMAMQEFGLGQVERVDLVNKGDYNAAYVHFKVWNNTSFVLQFQERAADPEQKCTLEYDCPWYWIVLENTSAKRVGPERRKEVINLRPDFMEPQPLASGVPYSVLEDLMWDMEQMQGTINELRATLEASGYQFQDDEPEPELDESATADDEINRELRGMKQEIEQLRDKIHGSNERIITCAVTGNKFREVLTVEYRPFVEVEVEDEEAIPRNILVRSTNQHHMGLRRSSSQADYDEVGFWDEWEPLEVPSDTIEGMYNQVFISKITNEVVDYGDLMDRFPQKTLGEVSAEM